MGVVIFYATRDKFSGHVSEIMVASMIKVESAANRVKVAKNGNVIHQELHSDAECFLQVLQSGCDGMKSLLDAADYVISVDNQSREILSAVQFKPQKNIILYKDLICHPPDIGTIVTKEVITCLVDSLRDDIWTSTVFRNILFGEMVVAPGRGKQLICEPREIAVMESESGESEFEESGQEEENEPVRTTRLSDLYSPISAASDEEEIIDLIEDNTRETDQSSPIYIPTPMESCCQIEAEMAQIHEEEEEPDLNAYMDKYLSDVMDYESEQFIQQLVDPWDEY